MEKTDCIYPDCQIKGEWAGTACEHSCAWEMELKQMDPIKEAMIRAEDQGTNKMSLVERLRNPQWETDGHAKTLAIEQTRSTMDDAADGVERLTDDLQECESRYMELSGQLRAAVREREDWNGKHQIAVMEIDKLVNVLERHGFRRCDIPACNCGSWHDGT